jgi:ribosome-associated protein
VSIHRFQLQGEFIELNVLLKLLALAPSGGGAKALIVEGAVTVDGVVESRIRRKLRAGNSVRVADQEIRVLATDDEPAPEESGTR